MTAITRLGTFFHIDLTRHWNIGKRITVYGKNAMSWAVNIHTKRWGYICFNIPYLSKWNFHFYCSPNATPWASTFWVGSDGKGSVWSRSASESVRAKVRLHNFGHNFNTDKHWDALTAINNKFGSVRITEYDIEMFGDKPESDD